MSFSRPEPKSPTATATEDDIEWALACLRADPGSMPYLHAQVHLSSLVKLFAGDRDRAICAVNALVDRGQAWFHEDASPPIYQTTRAVDAFVASW